MAKEEKKQWGGKREGAGRKSKGGDEGTHRIAFRASEDVYKILDQQMNKTEYIESAIRQKYKRERGY